MNELEYPERPKEEEIFLDDIDTLVEKVYPSHEGQMPLFKKFGTRTGGICDCWLYTKDWKELPEIEKWKYVAYCALYWEAQYEYWFEQERFKNKKIQVKEWAEKNPEFLKTLEVMEASEQFVKEKEKQEEIEKWRKLRKIPLDRSQE